MNTAEVKNLLCKALREKPETLRASRKMGNIDFAKLRHMGLNENVFGMSPKALEAISEASATSNLYADWTQKELKEAIAKTFGLTTDYVITGCGSSAMIDAMGTAFLDPGDELILCMPTFPAIIDTAQMQGASVKVIPLKDDLKYDLTRMLMEISSKTKMIYICNPNNPTGTYLGIDELRQFASECPDDVIQVYDEAYIEFAEASDCQSIVEVMKEMPEKPIVCLKTFSKFYGMAGVRVGYSLAQPEISSWLAKCGTQFGVSKTSQAAAAAAIMDKEHGAYVHEQVRRGREYLAQEMKALGCEVYDSQTNFIFFDAHVDPLEVQYRMMEKGIFISAQAGMNRVSVSYMEDCERFILYLAEIMHSLKATA